jgi:two-component system chemotaxis response regulator CheB
MHADRPPDAGGEPRRDIIVIGASAGGVEALQALVAGLPRNLPAAVCVVNHVSGRSPGVLDRILARAGRLPAELARHGAPITPGRIYVARPDHHLFLRDGVLQVTRGPRENRCRPAIDVLFRSAASTHGPRVIGVLLTGLLDDGTAGLRAVKAAGGMTIVQDPEDAPFGDMPRNALKAVAVDHCLPLAEIPAALVRLTATSALASVLPAWTETKEERMETKGETAVPSFYSCPECGGVLSEVDAGPMVTFRCHVGHAFSTQALLEGQDDGLEHSLWVAVRILEEQASFYRRLANKHGGGNMPQFVRANLEKADEAERHAVTIRQILESGAASKAEEPGVEMPSADPAKS